MPWLLTALFVTGALLLTIISATLSFLFCRTLGTGPIEGLAYGTAAATIDVLKVLAPFALARAWHNRQLGRGVASILVWAVAVAVSVSSAIGLAAENRLGRSHEQEVLQGQLSDTKRQLAEAERHLGAFAQTRPTKEVAANLRAIEEKPIAVGRRMRTLVAITSNCTRPDRITAADCATTAALRIELARAEARDEAAARVAHLRQRIALLHEKGAGEGRDTDSQAATIMRVLQAATGMTTTIPAVQTALIALIALALEIGSTCALYAALGSHAGSPSTAERKNPETTSDEPPATAAVASYCDARLIEEKGARLSMREALADYLRWSAESALKPVDSAEFLSALRREGQGRGWSMAGGIIHHVALVAASRARCSASDE